ncbi:MAG: hypothetical protein IJK26_00070 [Clostridia bacterium]|nr:hypothetical protein [Clostridia bacterium]
MEDNLTVQKYKVIAKGTEIDSFEAENREQAINYHLAHSEAAVNEALFNGSIQLGKNQTARDVDIRLLDEHDRVIHTSNKFLAQFVNLTTEEWNDLKFLDRGTSDEPSVYFDIDGTTGKWNPNATMEEIFDTKNHYFAKVEPEPYVIDLAYQLYLDGVDTCIVTATAKDTIPDKYDWIKKNIPFIKDENIFFAPLGADKTQFIKGNADISALIDDYNPNLKAWREAGGNAIKMLNGINSSHSGFTEISFEGLKKKKAELDEWLKNTDATETQVEQIQNKVVSHAYHSIAAVADTIEREIGHDVEADKGKEY